MRLADKTAIPWEREIGRKLHLFLNSEGVIAELDFFHGAKIAPTKAVDWHTVPKAISEAQK